MLSVLKEQPVDAQPYLEVAGHTTVLQTGFSYDGERGYATFGSALGMSKLPFPLTC